MRSVRHAALLVFMASGTRSLHPVERKQEGSHAGIRFLDVGSVGLANLPRSGITAVAIVAGHARLDMNVLGQILPGNEQPWLVFFPNVGIVVTRCASVLLRRLFRAGERLGRCEPSARHGQRT